MRAARQLRHSQFESVVNIRINGVVEDYGFHKSRRHHPGPLSPLKANAKMENTMAPWLFSWRAPIEPAVRKPVKTRPKIGCE